MAFTFVQAATPVADASGVTHTITYAGNSTTGNLLILAIITQGAPGLSSVTLTNSVPIVAVPYATASGGGSPTDGAIYYAIAGNSGSPLTWTVTLNSGNNCVLMAYEWSNSVAVGLEQVTTWTDSSTVGIAATGSALTPTHANDLAFSLVTLLQNNPVSGFAFGGGYTLRNNATQGTNYLTYAGDQVLSGSPSTTPSASWSGAGNHWGITQALFGPISTPYVVQASTLTHVGGAATAAASLTGVTGGNTLLMLAGYIDAGNNSQIPNGASDSQNGAMALDVQIVGGGGAHQSSSIYRISGASAGSHTATATKNTNATAGNVNWSIQLIEVAGLSSISSLDTTASANGSSTGPVTLTSGTLKSANDFVVVSGGSSTVATTGFVTPTNWTPLGLITTFPPADNAYLIPGSTAALSPSLGTIGPAQAWQVVLAAYQPQSLTVAYSAPTSWGPGITPNKMTMFRGRQLSAFVTLVAPNFARGYAGGYGYASLLQLSHITARGYSGGYGVAQLTIQGTPGIPMFRGPGISADWVQTFIDRPLATVNQQTPIGPITAYGYAGGYGFATGPVLGFIAASGSAGGYGYAQSLAIAAMQAAGYAEGLGWGSLSQYVSAAYGYAFGYGRANLIGLAPTVIMPNVTWPVPQSLESVAVSLLTSLGLNVNVGSINSTLTPPGYVAKQNPIPGTVVNVGATVSIYISIGQFVRPPNPNLGYKVTSRVFSLEELVSREWGATFRAPDHRIYVWSNNRAFDSTDIGNTGIYQKGTSTS